MRIRTALVAAATLAALLAGCGDDETSTDETSTAETSTAETSTAETAPADTEPADTEPADTEPADTDGAANGGATLTISGFAFTEIPDAVAGEPITVVNEDGAVHTVTAEDGSFDTGNIDTGASAELVIAEPGTYAFFCEIHRAMVGEITVS